MTSIAKFGKKLGEWADATFRDRRTPMRCLLHLKREVEEVIADPTDRYEYADCFMLLLDAARKAGISPDELVQAGYEKLEICRHRKYHPPDHEGVIIHIKED